jgi:hypothetical protein
MEALAPLGRFQGQPASNTLDAVASHIADRALLAGDGRTCFFAPGKLGIFRMSLQVAAACVGCAMHASAAVVRSRA